MQQEAVSLHGDAHIARASNIDFIVRDGRDGSEEGVLSEVWVERHGGDLLRREVPHVQSRREGIERGGKRAVLVEQNCFLELRDIRGRGR